MELQTLKVSLRQNKGKSHSGRTRKQGLVPAILYGGGGESLPLTVNTRILTHLLHGKQGEHAIVQIEVEENPELNSPAMVKDVQHHPVRGEVTHADFMRIRLDQRIRTFIPVRTEGQCKGVIEGGLLDHQSREIEVECLATEIPEAIVIDVTELDIGATIHVSELSAPEGSIIITPGERAVVAVHAPRVQAEEEEAEAVEGEEVEGEAAEGEAAEGEAERPAEDKKE